jgi:hypothetical protein
MSSYTLTEVPQAPGDGSRFYLAQTPAGWSTDPGEAVGAAFQEFVSARRQAMNPLHPTPITVALKLAVKVGGEWVLEERGTVTAVPSLASERPGKLGQTKLKGGALLDAFGLGKPEAWEKATDAEVFETLRVVCEAHDLEGRAWTLQDSVCRLVALRAGIVISEEALPHVSVMQKTVVG